MRRSSAERSEFSHRDCAYGNSIKVTGYGPRVNVGPQINAKDGLNRLYADVPQGEVAS